MAEITVDKVYGSALFQVAAEVGKQELILEEGAEILGILEQETELFAFMNSPVISPAQKKEVLNTIFENKISEELLNLIFLLVDKGRTKHFPKIIKTYRNLLNEQEGFSYGKIFSAVLLKEEQLKKFEEETGKLLQKNVKLENFQDTNLIGGIKVFIEGKVIDASLRKRLIDLNQSILNGEAING